MKKQSVRASWIGLTNLGGIGIITNKKCIEHIKRVEREV
jgi:hypothetical protein